MDYPLCNGIYKVIIFAMLNRSFVVILALLIANPICCCQDISSLWSSAEVQTSCGCQHSSENETPTNEPCSACPSKIHKVFAGASLELPAIQVNDLVSHPSLLFSGSGILSNPRTMVLTQAPYVVPKQVPLCVAYCVYLL